MANPRAPVTTPNNDEGISDDDRRRMIFKKALRKKRRKERDAEGEIHDLNIYPMLDMMTIILVFLLKSYSATSVTLTGVDDMSPPTSSTTTNPKETVAVTITAKHVLLDNKPVLALGPDGKVPPDEKVGGADGMIITPLQTEFRKKVDQLKKIASYNPQAPFTGELSVIADQHVPYRLLMEVLYTAGQEELGNYRFIVIQSEGAGTAKPAGT
jgi:biopolymer transport protein ExbD